MRKVDEIFLQIFKDLKIEASTGSGYKCILGKDTISNREVVKMVKDYQDAIIQTLLEDK